MEASATVLENVNNDAESSIVIPYVASITVKGTSPLLFHRWSVEGVEAKSHAAKGSKAKKSDDIESYVYRNDDGQLCLPSEYFRGSLVNAAKFQQDPRSPRKSAMDLFKAGVCCIEELCTLGVKDWDYLDRRRVMIQRSGITRVRPAMHTGWTCEVSLQILLPEYISQELLNATVQAAGRLVGVGDFRPTYGRFLVTKFEKI